MGFWDWDMFQPGYKHEDPGGPYKHNSLFAQGARMGASALNEQLGRLPGFTPVARSNSGRPAGPSGPPVQPWTTAALQDRLQMFMRPPLRPAPLPRPPVAPAARRNPALVRPDLEGYYARAEAMLSPQYDLVAGQKYVDSQIAQMINPLLTRTRQVEESRRGNVFNSNRVQQAYARDTGVARKQTRNAYGNLLRTIAAADKGSQGSAKATQNYLGSVYGDYQGTGADVSGALADATTQSSAKNAGKAVRGTEASDSQGNFLSNAALVGSSQNAEYIRGENNRATQERNALLDQIATTKSQRAGLLEEWKERKRTSGVAEANALLAIAGAKYGTYQDQRDYRLNERAVGAKTEAEQMSALAAAQEAQDKKAREGAKEVNKIISQYNKAAMDPVVKQKALEMIAKQAYNNALAYGVIPKGTKASEFYKAYGLAG